MAYLIGAALIGVTAFVVGSWLFRHWRLAKDGVVVRGRVVRKFSPFSRAKGPLAGVIKYDFLTPRGEYVEKSVVVGEAVLLVCEEGSDIDVVYLKGNPHISGTRQLVNATRESLKLPPLSAASTD